MCGLDGEVKNIFQAFEHPIFVLSRLFQCTTMDQCEGHSGYALVPIVTGYRANQIAKKTEDF